VDAGSGNGAATRTGCRRKDIPANGRYSMKFIVEPQKEEKQEKHGGMTTMCAQCSENPIFCYDF